MPRLNIQQFRALIAGRNTNDAAANAYRQLASRPTLVAGLSLDGWIPWGVADTSRAAA